MGDVSDVFFSSFALVFQHFVDGAGGWIDKSF